LRVDRINWKSHKEPFIIHFNTLKNEDDHETNKEYKEKELKCMALYDESIQGGKLNRKDHFKLKQLRHELREIKKSHRMIKEETIEVNCQGYLATSIFTDVVQRALICPLITSHILFHSSLPQLQHSLNYQFSNKTLLEQALTHSSYLLKHSISSSPITLTAASRCGRRLPVSMATHEAPPTKKPKSGIEGLLDVTQEGDMPGFESDNILQKNNERLEFLGDAVIEFICSMRLYDMFPVLTDGQLVLFRKALICNQNLTTVAKRINLRQYLLTEQYPEEIMSLLPSSNDDGSDRYDNCLANTMEAVIGAIYLDGGLKHCHNVLASLLFPDNDLCRVWLRVYKDPLKRENPDGDRHMVDSIELLKSFTSLEESIGVTFSNIRLLARAFTHPSYGYTSLMLGDYQRMEFLGDAILQLVTSTYVYQSFPLHNEGHLSAFRTAIVCNKQLSLVSLELGFNNYIILGKDQKNDITDKILADVVESFISALYLDKGIEYVETFCRVCLFPKLAQSAEGLQFLDAKTRLQHAIVYTCKREGNEIEVPIYKVLNIEGPVNKQIFTVGVYFRGKRLAVGTGSNSQKAGMEAAEKSLASGHIRLPSSLRIRKNV
jgi:ribonuclease-3